MGSVTVIAEVGSNHAGSSGLAFDLISTAAQCGADVVKFQAFDSSIWDSPEAWEKRKGFQIDAQFAKDMALFAEKLGLEFMCTPCYPGAVEWLDPLVRRWKIASADLGNETLVKAIIDTKKQAFYSTGVRKTPKFFRKDWIPLHCVSRYPAMVDEYALPGFTIEPLPWGISDHTLGSTLAVAAVARGATVVEKHLRLNDQPWSPDKDHSMSPIAFMAFVSAIRETERLVANLTSVGPRLAPGRKVYL